MTNILDGVVSKLLSQYRFEVEDTVPEDLTCVVCKKLIIDAYQTYCECQYCRGCITDYLSAGDVHCRGGKTECAAAKLALESNVHRDYKLNEKISKLKVICPNESCTHSGELTEMEEHLQICDKQSNGCQNSSPECDNARESEVRTLTHLHNDPLMHAQLLIEKIDVMKNEFDQLKKDFEMSKSQLESLMEKINLKENQISRMMEQITSLVLENKILKDDANNLRSTVNILDGKSLKNQSQTETKLNALQYESEMARWVENETCAKLNLLESTINRINACMNTMSSVGEILFKVDGFRAKKRSKQTIHSPYFYSHKNGYKLGLDVIPGGDSYLACTHVSVYLVICIGENDDFIPWPCNGYFNVSILNQLTKESYYSMTLSHSSAIHSSKYCFYKPTKTDNVPYGSSQFIPHQLLDSIPGLIVDDCVIIKCVFTP